eukprot:1494816-Pyramimonas_sp.AAC.1
MGRRGKNARAPLGKLSVLIARADCARWVVPLHCSYVRYGDARPTRTTKKNLRSRSQASGG